VPDCLALIEGIEVHALCHVTGGGLPGNVPRALPEGLGAELDRNSWTPAPIFGWLADRGPVSATEMWRTFNMGVGMVAIVPPTAASDAVALLFDRGVEAWPLGIVTDLPGVTGLA
jgi:phosphoribosylformylglycinamidine cyclo-ligase